MKTALIIFMLFAATQCQTYQITSNQKADSLQAILDGIMLKIYSDKTYKKSIDFEHSDKVEYYKHLIKYNIKDTASVLEHAKSLLETYDIQCQIYRSLIAEEYSNANGCILAYIKNIRLKMSDLTTFIVSLSND